MLRGRKVIFHQIRCELLGALRPRQPMFTFVGFRQFSVQPVVATLQQKAKSLRNKTSYWLEIPLQSWSRAEVLRGRHLTNAWASVVDGRNSLSKPSTKYMVESVLYQSRIFQRFVEYQMERKGKGSLVHQNMMSSAEIVEMLHQCLDSWKRIDSTDDLNPPERSWELLCMLDDAAILHDDPSLRPGDKAFTMCLNALAVYPVEKAAFEFFMEIWNRRHQLRSQPDLQFYNACLHSLAKLSPGFSEAAEQAEIVLKESSKNGCNPDRASFVSLMHAWANRSDYDSAKRAQAILDRLIELDEDENKLLSPESFNVCIDGWAKANSPLNAEAVLWRMQQLSQEGKPHLKPTAVSFNSAINGWAKSTDARGAKRAKILLRKMEQFGCAPTLESFTSVMDAWTRHEKNPGLTVELMLNQMEHMNADNVNKVAPNKLSYAIAIRAWGNTMNDDAPIRAQALVDRMKQISACGGRDDLSPCLIIYSTFLHVWSKSNRADAAEQVVAIFEEMQKSESVKCTTSTLNLVLDSLSSRGLGNKAKELLIATEMRGKILPDQASYDIIMKAYAMSRAPDAADNASRLLRKMERGRNAFIAPSITTYIHAIVAWGNSSQPDSAEKAEALFWDILDSSENNNEPKKAINIILVNCVLRAWAKSREGGASQKAEKFYRKLGNVCLRHQIEFDATTYFHLLQAWAHSGRRIGPQKAEEYFAKLKELCKSDRETFVLSTSQYNLLLLAWSRSRLPGAPARVEEIFEEMSELERNGFPVAPDLKTYQLALSCVSVGPGRSSMKEREILKKIKNYLGS